MHGLSFSVKNVTYTQFFQRLYGSYQVSRHRVVQREKPRGGMKFLSYLTLLLGPFVTLTQGSPEEMTGADAGQDAQHRSHAISASLAGRLKRQGFRVLAFQSLEQDMYVVT